MAELFFSYSSKDRERVRPIQEALTALGFDVCWDQQVPAGWNWNTWIREQLTAARCVVVFWSLEAVGSDNISHEATIAKEQGKIVPVMLDLLRVEQFPMGLFNTQAARLIDWSGDGDEHEWRKLLAEIESKVIPRWAARRIANLEAELKAEAKRRETAQAGEDAVDAQLNQEIAKQGQLRRERERAQAETEAARAELAGVKEALDAAKAQNSDIAERLASVEGLAASAGRRFPVTALAIGILVALGVGATLAYFAQEAAWTDRQARAVTEARTKAEAETRQTVELEVREREKTDAEIRERERVEAQTRDRERFEAERVRAIAETERLEAARRATERRLQEAEARERERVEAQKRDRVTMETERAKAIAETERLEAARRDTERRLQEAEARERERVETQKRDRVTMETERAKAIAETQRLEVARRDVERRLGEAEARERERAEAQKRERERVEAERKSAAERRELEQKRLQAREAQEREAAALAEKKRRTLEHTALYGSPISPAPRADSAAACREACLSDAKCKGFEFNRFKNCWNFSTISQQSYELGSVSGRWD